MTDHIDTRQAGDDDALPQEPPAAEPTGTAPVTGRVRVGRKTKALVKELVPGEIAVIDHADLDRVAAETLAAARPAAVINASASITGRYPNVGPLFVLDAGIPIFDNAGPAAMELVDGTTVTVRDGELATETGPLAAVTELDVERATTKIETARATMGAELERFAANTLAYIQREGHLLVDEPDVPDVDGVDFKGRHVLIVVRGTDYKEDLDILRRSGYLREQKPLLIGVDGGADALREIGEVPDVIIGDFDSVSEETLRSGARLVVHGYRNGRAPGASRLEDLGLDYEIYGSEGTSEDIAMLLAYEKGATLIVAVGTHNSMVEFLDKGREGMASTFLVRMKVGPMLVDAKGVSRLYRRATVRSRDLLLMVVAALITFAIVIAVSEPIRLVIRSSWLTLTS